MATTPTQILLFEAWAQNETVALGPASLDLPAFTAVTETISGAGIAGEVELSAIGHFGSITATLRFRAPTSEVNDLMAPIAHQIDLRGSLQRYDRASGALANVPIRWSVLGTTKEFKPGKMEPGKQMETEWTCEVVRLVHYVDGEKQYELDKLVGKFEVKGVDYMAGVRRDVGL